MAFVLSGGASLAPVGMLRALYEREIAADAIVGTSAGAFIASRPQTVATADALAAVSARGISRMRC